MTDEELSHIQETYRTAQHFLLGHVYRDIMKLVCVVKILKEELAILKNNKTVIQPLVDSLK